MRAARRDAGSVFIGIGPTADVEAYLAGVDRDHLARLGDGRGPTWERVAGTAPPTPPTPQGFWAASTAGTGPQQLVWHATGGSWAVAVMDADTGHPVDVDIAAGVTAPGLAWLWTGLFVGAGVALVVGGLVVGFALRTARD